MMSLELDDQIERRLLNDKLDRLREKETQLRQKVIKLQRQRPRIGYGSSSSSERSVSLPPEDRRTLNIIGLKSAIVRMDVYNLPDHSVEKKIPNAFKSVYDYRKHFYPNFMNEVTGYIEASLTKNNLSSCIKVKLLSKPNHSEDQGKFHFETANDIDSADFPARSLYLIVPGHYDQLPNSLKQWAEKDIKAQLLINSYGIRQQAFKVFREGMPRLTDSEEKNYTMVFLERLSTIERECKTLFELTEFCLLREILQPKNWTINEASQLPESFLVGLDQHFNSAQSRIIKQTCKLRKGIALIEGPAGTGKTETIVGILSGLLLNPLQLQNEVKILVCGPSNAAVNAIMLRILRLGLFEESFDRTKDVKMVRVGSARCKVPRFLHKQQEYSDEYIEELVSLVLTNQVNRTIEQLQAPFRDQITQLDIRMGPQKKEIQKLNDLKQRGMLRHLSEQRDEFQQQLESLTQELEEGTCSLSTPSGFSAHQGKLAEIESINQALSEVETEYAKHINAINSRIRVYQSQIEPLVKQRMKFVSEINRIRQENLKTLPEKIIREASIVFATLSSSGIHELSNLSPSFDYLIVDEACQCSELSCLIPFQYSISRAVLVGDPRQLPATTFAESAAKSRYDRSLFERMLKNGCIAQLLSIQYRMTHEICAYPSEAFYQFELETAAEVMSRATPEWVPSPALQYINVLSSREMRDARTLSVYNPHEAVVAVFLAMYLQSRSRRYIDVGIVTPYRRQIHELKALVKVAGVNGVEINSVDGFQGREKDFVILSCVRTDRIGFLVDWRRANVALTRAKFGMWILGHSRLLTRDKIWRGLVHHHIERDTIINVDDCFELAALLQVNAIPYFQAAFQLQSGKPCGHLMEKSQTLSKNPHITGGWRNNSSQSGPQKQRRSQNFPPRNQKKFSNSRRPRQGTQHFISQPERSTNNTAQEGLPSQTGQGPVQVRFNPQEYEWPSLK